MAWWHLELSAACLARAQRLVLGLAFGCLDAGAPQYLIQSISSACGFTVVVILLDTVKMTMTLFEM